MAYNSKHSFLAYRSVGPQGSSALSYRLGSGSSMHISFCDPGQKSNSCLLEANSSNGLGQWHKRGYPFLNGRNISTLFSTCLELEHCRFSPHSIVQSKSHDQSQWMEQGIYFNYRGARERAVRKGKIVNKWYNFLQETYYFFGFIYSRRIYDPWRQKKSKKKKAFFLLSSSPFPVEC